MELRLPDNPTEGDLVLIEKYLKEAKKKLSGSVYGKKNSQRNKKTLIAGKLIIFQPSQRVKGDNYSMRYYVGDRKYKVLSLATNDETVATEKALEKQRLISVIENGAMVINFDEVIVEKVNAPLPVVSIIMSLFLLLGVASGCVYLLIQRFINDRLQTNG